MTQQVYLSEYTSNREVITGPPKDMCRNVHGSALYAKTTQTPTNRGMEKSHNEMNKLQLHPMWVNLTCNLSKTDAKDCILCNSSYMKYKSRQN